MAFPVHIWQGEEDRMALPIQAHTLSEMMPRAELHLIPGAGHLAIFAHFGEILDALDISDNS
jgi:pimeloyl-ACP methyl ester carboxylesterase